MTAISMRILIIHFLLCSFGLLYGNPEKGSLDSLLKEERINKKLDSLLELTREVWPEKLDEAQYYSDLAIKVLPECSDSFRIVRAYRVKGIILSKLERHSEVLSLLQIPLEIARRNLFYDEVSKILNLIGIAQIFLGNHGKALESYFEALLLRESHEGIELSNLYNNIGLVYYKIRNLERAIYYYKKALEIDIRDGVFNERTNLLLNIGLCYVEMGQFEKALEYIEDGRKNCGNSCEPREILSINLALGMAKLDANELYSSEAHLNSALATARKLDDPRFSTELLNLLAELYIKKGDYKKALTILNEAESIALSMELRQLLLVTYKKIIIVLKKLNNCADQSRYYLLYNALREKIYGENFIQSIAAFQASLAHHHNQKRLYEQRHKATLQKRAQQLILWLRCGIGCVIVLLIAAIIGCLFTVKTNRNIKEKLAEKLEERLSNVYCKNIERGNSEEILIVSTQNILAKVKTCVCQWDYEGRPNYTESIAFSRTRMLEVITSLENLLNGVNSRIL